MKHVFLVTSHNTRIQCLLNKIERTFGKTRFKNCAIIRVSISVNEIIIEIVDSGKLADSELHKLSEKRQYYVSNCEAPEVSQKRERYNPVKVTKKWSWFKPKINIVDPFKKEEDEWIDFPEPDEQSNIFIRYPYEKFTGIRVNHILQKLGINPEKEEYVFYIIRHGQAQHNERVFNTGHTLDTPLTAEGKHQAYESGKRLVQILADKDEYPTTLFVSDLQRTHQTMNNVIEGMKITIDNERGVPTNCTIKNHWFNYQDKKTKLKDMIKNLYYMHFFVLPCSSELSILDENGNCDLKSANSSFTKKIARENYPSGKRAPHIDNHPINWRYYLDFYKGNRGEIKWFKNESKHCRDTSMLKEAIHIYLNKDNQFEKEGLVVTNYSTLGGTRRRNRKRRTKRT